MTDHKFPWDNSLYEPPEPRRPPPGNSYAGPLMVVAGIIVIVTGALIALAH